LLAFTKKELGLQKSST